ncbi:hypothetical protein SAMN02745866_04350 [Alteromonadaceae bacterium Bs31]|nr:hypothetical protein SAMN02745866_04350 [Alteromonadaceae bacterium Bs31]
MHNVILFLIGLVFSVMASANEECNKIVSGYENSDTIYVVCDDLSDISQEAANKLIKEIFNQYKGPPDEIFVFFISSTDYVGKFEFPPEVWVADYYTHHNQLTIWPKVKEKTRVIKIQW